MRSEPCLLALALFFWDLHALHKYRKWLKDFSHRVPFPNLEAMDGYHNTHTHACKYKCISVRNYKLKFYSMQQKKKTRKKLSVPPTP